MEPFISVSLVLIIIICVSIVTSIRGSQVTYQIVRKEVLTALFAGMGP